MLALIHTIVARLLGVLRSRNAQSEFDQELDAHLAMAVEGHLRRGMSPEQARRTARLEMGGVAQLREAAHAARGLPWLSGFGLDLKLGVRMLRKSWGLTLVGGLAMAVTIGLGASVFTIWETLTGTSLPLDEGDRVVAIQRFDAGTTGSRTTPLPDFARWRNALRSVTDVSAMRRSVRNVITPDGSSRQVSVAEMTASGFRVARVRPLLGRPLIEDDERDGADLVAVIGQEVWESGFSSDPGVLGRRVQLDETFYTVVGVMPAAFAFPVSERIWTPLRNDRSAPAGGTREVFVFARLAPGVTIEGSRAEVATVGMLPPDAAAEGHERLPPRVVPYAAGLFDGPGASAWLGGVILFIVALLLVPPCANIGILVYARTVTRQAEFAARSALGASRSRIVMQIFIEVLVLSAAAGIAGFLLARQFAAQLSRIVTPGMGSQNMPFWMDLTPSGAALFCAAGLAVVAAAIAGGIPALHATGGWRQSGLGIRGSTGRLGRTWTALLAIQVALSLAILPSAMELTWGIFRPSIVGPGFPIDEFLTAELTMAVDTSRFGNVQADMVRQLRASGGVSGVTVSATALTEEPQPEVEMEGSASGTTDVSVNDVGNVSVNYVDDAFFGVFDARFLAGRGFDAGDFVPGRTAVIVNRSFVEDAVGEGNPLGRRVRYSRDLPDAPDPSGWFEIVGVVDDFIANDHISTMYHPLVPGQHHPVSVALRVGSNVTLVAETLREIAGAVDPTLRVGRLRSLGDLYRQRRSPIMMFGLVLVTVMGIVLLFTIAGNYTLMAFTVAQRWREIGLRSALGAQPRRLVADIFGRALLPLVAGAVVGGLLALLIDSNVDTTLVGGLGIPGLVPACATFIIVVGLLALIGPARRALRIDPAVALRDG